jgi:hypothetical protein
MTTTRNRDAVTPRPRSARRTFLVAAGAFALFVTALLIGRASAQPPRPPSADVAS